jgi:hypothetical protein
MTVFIGVSSEEMEKRVTEYLDQKISKDMIKSRTTTYFEIITINGNRYMVRRGPLEMFTCGLELDTVYLESCLPLSLLWTFIPAAHCDIRNIKIFDEPEDIHIDII